MLKLGGRSYWGWHGRSGMEGIIGMVWKERYGRSGMEGVGRYGRDGWNGRNGWNSVQRYNFSLILPNLGV